MHIESWPTDKPIPYARNARQISQKAVDKVAASIREFGWRQPIVVDGAGVIVAGHTRLLAAQKLGLLEVPVHVAANLTAAQVKAYRLMDNRSHQEAQWDVELLGPEMSELKDLAVDLSLTGFDAAEIEKLLLPESDEAADACPAVEDGPAVTVLGDCWLLGPHRLVCGDSTSSDAVSRACGAVLGLPAPFLMVTDPPYGVEYDPTWRDGKGGFSTAPVKQRGKVTNDDRAEWTDALRLFAGDVAYVWFASLKAADVVVALADAQFEARALIIWAKQQAVFSQGHYHWQHEPCWYAVRKGQAAHWHGDRTQSTVWSVQNLNPTGNRTEERVGHGTQKPVELMRRPILNHTERGEVVYDPFLGSGTTLIAAEETGRICYGLEIDPRYCDVIVKRWQDFTGKQAKIEDGGATFEQARFGRRLGAQDAIAEEVLSGA